jgi:hypothetical protein
MFVSLAIGADFVALKFQQRFDCLLVLRRSIGGRCCSAGHFFECLRRITQGGKRDLLKAR